MTTLYKTVVNLTFLLLVILDNRFANAQYEFRGRVFNELRQFPMTSGNIRLGARPGSLRSNRKNPTIAKIDSLGYFTITLNDSANVTFVIDCYLGGMDVKTVSWADTLMIFNVRAECSEYNVTRATDDIGKNTPKLLCTYGYTMYKFTDADTAFEKKYGIKYRSFGDEPIWSDCMWLYNKTIAEFLDKKFGPTWRNEVRWDVDY